MAQNGSNPPPSLGSVLSTLATVPVAYVCSPFESTRFLGSTLRNMVGKQFNPDTDIDDQSGKTILMTGGSVGIGKEAILQLAKHKPSRIFLASRNPARAQATITDIQSQLSEPVDIRHLPLNLSSFSSIRAAAAEFTSLSNRLDTLILNAGTLDFVPSLTEDGYENDMGTNHLGHFLFTKLLLPTLLSTAEHKKAEDSIIDVRVITVSSMSWFLAPSLSTMFSTESLFKLNPAIRYGTSKAANIIFSSELARRYPQLTCVSIHPGTVATGIFDSVREVSLIARFFFGVARAVIANEKQGCLNHLWAAGSEIGKLESGEYYTPVGVGGWHNRWAEDTEAGKTLWEWSDIQVSRKG